MRVLVEDMILWCAIQSSAIAVVGIAVSLFVVRRHPAVAACVASSATLVVGLISCVAWFPLHESLVVELAGSSQSASYDTVTTESSSGVVDGAESPSRADTFLAIDFSHLPTLLRGAARANEVNPELRAASTAVIWLMLATAALGLGRLGVALHFVRRTRQSGVKISSPQAVDVLEDVCDRLACEPPKMLVSPRLSSAAVVGFFRPALFLPTHWERWSDTQLQSVIAHEVAHIVRRDAVWRALSAAVAAIHWFNPIMHWLARRLLLYQELSADVLAANIVGSGKYLKSLSSLAMERDRLLRQFGNPDLMPVFSGELIRRITMLQTTDVHRRTNGNHPRQSARIAIMFLMVAVGIGSIGIRGLAQIRTDVGSSDTETANLQVDLLSKDKAANQVTGVFAREPLDPDIIGPNNSGMFVLRTRELFERPEFEQLRGLANTGLAAVISELSRELAASKVRPTVDIGGIEWIAGQANMTIRSGTDDEMKDKTRLMVGGSRLVMKLTQPFDLKQWIQKYFPDTKSHDIDGTTVYVLPNTPFLGPYPLGVAQLDNRTVATRTLPREVIDEHKPKVPVTPTFWGNTAKVSRWAPAWNRSDGGLGTFLVTDSEIYDLGRHRDDMSDVERTLGDLGNNVHLRTSLMSYAFDIDASTSAVRVRMNYSHSSRGTATQSAKELADAVTLLATPEGQMYLRGNSEPSDGDVQWHIMLSDALTGLTTDVKELDDGTADLTVALSFPLEPLVKMFLRDIQEEFQSTNDNVRVREARDTEPASRN